MYRLATLVAAVLVASAGAAHAAGSYQTKPMFPEAAKATTGSGPEASLPKLSPADLVGGCGKGRVRDPQTHQCRGPGDIGH
jgi:hypothetical protein